MSKKKLIHNRCVHMPTKENTVVIFSSKNGSKFDVGFTIGVQDFTVRKECTSEESDFTCNMLEEAFKKLIEPKIPKAIKSKEALEKAKDFYRPQVKIINLK